MNSNIKIIRSAISSLPSVGVIKFLKEKGFTVIGCDITSSSAAKFFTDDFFLVDKATQETQKKIIEQYKSAIIKHNAKWIISGPENEILALAQYENEIAQYDCLLFHPSKQVLNIITDKFILYENLQGIIPLKELCLLKDFSKAKCFSSNKLIVKPRTGRGSNAVFTIQNQLSDLTEIANKLNNDLFVIQEFIDGREFTVDILCDTTGALLNAVIRERLLVDSGIAIAAKTVKIDRIFEYINRILKHFTFRGFNCIQFREQANEFYLTDINPRIGGGSILSLNADDSMAENFINLLSFKYEKLKYNNFDTKEKTMYRYYSEVYE